MQFIRIKSTLLNRFFFTTNPTKKKDNNISRYAQNAFIGLATLSACFVFYFFWNMDNIALERIKDFEGRSGIKYHEFKCDVPLDLEYRKEYIDRQKRIYKSKLDIRKQQDKQN